MRNAPASTKLGRWYEWWFAAQWRAFLTWMVLAIIAGRLVEIDSELLDRHTIWMVSALNDYGIVLNASDFYIGNMVVAQIWFQPVALRIGLLRTVLWIVLASLAATVMLSVCPDRWHGLASLISVGNLAGLPGLLVTGVRTRPWLSPVGGLVSITALQLVNSLAPTFEWLRYSFLRDTIISQAIYAAVMLWGTWRIEPRERDGEPETKETGNG